MKVVPLTVTLINWPNLLQSAKDVMGRSPVAMLDEERNGERGAYAFIAALSELERPGEPTRDAIQTGLGFYNHYSVGFIVECSQVEALTLSPFEGLIVSHFRGNRKDLLIISETLPKWIPLIKYYRESKTALPARKEFFEEVYRWLCKLSLKEVL